ncbi:MAG: c-type cytochrome [Caulobacteraceae bacterium]
MSGDLTLNKYLGAGLATGLVIVGLTVVVPRLFETSPPAHPGYAIAVAPDLSGGAPEAPDVPPDWGTVLPTADVAAGQAKTAACQSCHDFSPAGTNKIGPGLWGVVGRKPGSHPGFAYSPAMTAFGAKQPIWDYDHLYEFIKGPQAYISGTKMTFVGLKQPQDRINVIAYLHSLGSSLPVPAPKPAAPAASKPGATKPGAPAPASVGAKPGGPA